MDFVTDIINLDLKSTLRVLYNLFTKYKQGSQWPVLLDLKFAKYGEVLSRRFDFHLLPSLESCVLNQTKIFFSKVQVLTTFESPFGSSGSSGLIFAEFTVLLGSIVFSVIFLPGFWYSYRCLVCFYLLRCHNLLFGPLPDVRCIAMFDKCLRIIWSLAHLSVSTLCKVREQRKGSWSWWNPAPLHGIDIQWLRVGHKSLLPR